MNAIFEINFGFPNYNFGKVQEFMVNLNNKKSLDYQIFNIFCNSNSNNSSILAVIWCTRFYITNDISKSNNFLNKTEKEYFQFIKKETQKLSELLKTLLSKKRLC